MSDFLVNLEKIRSAALGRDVRTAIYESLLHLQQNIAGTYILPKATASILGGIKIGDDFEVDANEKLQFSQKALKRFTDLEDDIINNTSTVELIAESLPVYNVLTYGVDNTGTENAKTIVQELLDLVGENGGGTVFFPNGTYYFGWSFNVPSNVRILGDTNTIVTAEHKDKPLRHSTFIRAGNENGTRTGYSSFSNVIIENIIFDMGGQWAILNDTLTYKAKYDTRHTYTDSDYLSFCPIVAAHGDGLTIKNCTFKNGIYAGFTGSSASAATSFFATNPHVMDLTAIRNLVIDGCIFEPTFTTSTALTNWCGKATGETGEADVNYSDLIQLDAAYGGGGDGTNLHLPSDGTNCRNVIIKNCHFYGLPYFDWKKVINNTGDDDSKILKTTFPLADSSGNDTSTMIKTNLSAFRFSPYAAVGCCHKFGTSDTMKYQPENVEIYNNIFEGRWSSHFSGVNAQVQIRWKNYSDDYKDSAGYYYPLYNGSPEVLTVRNEPARHGCHGAIYALPGSKGYNIHDNVFKEDNTDNKSTAVFFYGSECGYVHDNIFINYGEPLPAGTKALAMSTYTFSNTDLWNKSKTGYYDGLAYVHSSNNLWVRDAYDSFILNSESLTSLSRLNE